MPHRLHALTGRIVDYETHTSPSSDPNPEWLQRAAEDPFRLIFEHHPEPMWVFDTETFAFQAVNRAATELYGYSREEFLSMTLLDIRPEDQKAEFHRYCDTMRRSPIFAERGISDTWTHRKKNGEILEVTIKWRPIKQGNRVSIVSVIHEVTDESRKASQMNIQANALSQVTEAVFAVDNSRNIQYWNKAAEALYGYTADEVLGKALSSVIDYEYLSHTDESKARESLQTRGHWRGEKVHRRKDGRSFFVESSMNTLRSDDGAVVGIMAVSHDVTEQKKVRQALLETNEKLAAIIEASPVAIIVSDTQGCIKAWNPAATRIFGWTEKEMLGSSFHRLLPDGLSSDYCRIRDSVLKGGAFSNKETRHLCHSGALIDVSVSSAPLHDFNDKVIGVVSLITDITARKRTENELRLAKEAADSANRTKTQFVANISHEIRTPLSAILGFAEMMFDAKQTVSERMNCIARIRHNVKNLTALIEDLLDLSKVEAGKFEIAPTGFPLLPELSEVTTLLQNQILRKGLGLRILFKGPIPKTITSDPTRLRQILINVVGNAIKFTDRGTITITTWLDEKHSSDKVFLCFDIQDTGPGIPTDQRESIFEPFAQIDSSVSRRFGGTGLGLNLSRRLARILGGDVILAESQPGKGSLFRVLVDPGEISGVPMMENVTEADLRAKQYTEFQPQSASLTGMRVLLVEDGQDNRFLINHFLRSSGAQVDAAINGMEGAELARNKAYDLILMDIQMPILDGYQTTTKLRAEGVKTPIIALTAHAMKGEKQRCFDVGCNAYLSKPIDANTLVEMVSRYRNMPPSVAVH
ncbi:MAG: PAS domain S-box protein [Bdellovibrionales bacterium]|nr:PAS domain S-box protein [Bdellovibrionales bacterium]